MENVRVRIDKPVYGTKVYVRDVYVDTAIRRGVKLEISIPAGVGVVDPVEWKGRNDVMRKVFKDPKRPMVLYGGNVPIAAVEKGEVLDSEKEAARKKFEEDQIKLF